MLSQLRVELRVYTVDELIRGNLSEWTSTPGSEPSEHSYVIFLTIDEVAKV